MSLKTFFVMKTSDKERKLNPLVFILNSRGLSLSVKMLRKIQNDVELYAIALDANNTEIREYALLKIQSDKVLYEFCLNTDSPHLYDLAKEGICDEKFLKYLNMKEMVEEEYDEVVKDETFFLAEAS